jgi:hypothetical protein
MIRKYKQGDYSELNLKPLKNNNLNINFSMIPKNSIIFGSNEILIKYNKRNGNEEI